jgi:hypothetical protein
MQPLKGSAQPMSDKWQNDDSEQGDEQEDSRFQPLRKQSGKPQTTNESRRQQAKEWGRAVNKFHKQRRRAGEYNKP